MVGSQSPLVTIVKSESTLVTIVRSESTLLTIVYIHLVILVRIIVVAWLCICNINIDASNCLNV